MMEDQMVNCRTILCSQGEDDHFLSSRKWSTPIWTNPNWTTPAQKKYEMNSLTNTLAFIFSKHKSCILQEEIWKLENEKSDWNNWRQQKLHSAGGWKWSVNGKISDWKKSWAWACGFVWCGPIQWAPPWPCAVQIGRAGRVERKIPRL